MSHNCLKNVVRRDLRSTFRQ